MQRRLRIGLRIMHIRLGICPTKMHRRFFIGPPQPFLNLHPQDFDSQKIMLTIAIMKENQQNNLLDLEQVILRIATTLIITKHLLTQSFIKLMHRIASNNLWKQSEIKDILIFTWRWDRLG